MNVLIIGSGAREHAMAWAVARSSKVSTVFVAPGNGGTATMGGKVRNVAVKATDIEALLDLVARESIGLTVVGPEQPLEAGIVNRFREAGLKVVGPTAEAARLETSKVFAKEFMKRHVIPTAGYEVFRDYASAKAFLESCGSFPQVIKASGLCAGKGVVVAESREQALEAIHEFFESRIFGDAADEVVIESFLTGQEASVFALTDGEHYRLFLSAQDHKRIGEGDTGKNTGGMGAYAPAPLVTPEVMARVEEEVIRPTLAGMKADGYAYTGFLYVGLMIDNGAPSVVEYNARLGDPETQVVLPMLKSDLFDALLASVDGGLEAVPFEMQAGAAATVVMASAGYPDAYETGKAITIDPSVNDMKGVLVFHAGTRREGDALVTAGGRVLSVTACADSLKEALDRAYGAVAAIGFEGAYCRRDIGAKAL
ncbi:phosphoribosylamine--glycine ligase [Chlorobaculum thiosulfatiphilum]|uniref:Phosphoribosylamine--glycine ligase n=1 Tax=Chlorobaculum thiosulfatiphilum TaxID=115852 RepID=A0A5C4SA92_CHLTI|nr:phosphoribosylamine--glycine ligase [Chlorobaculum thiosulfatiphilum]TNJ39641.1 phosphoribosylamine--glycine ligase [Chlorobaculum thiosulfatiphilum]